MLSKEWFEETFQIFKSSPNSINVFDFIREKVEVLLKEENFEQLITCSEDSVSSYCGISFKKDQLLYHCRY